MNPKILGIGSVLLALSTLFLPFMAVGDITTGILVGVVKKPELLVFLVPALAVGSVAALGALRGYPRRRVVVTVVLAVVNLAAFVLMMVKLRDGATAGLALWATAGVPVLAVLAAVGGRARSGVVGSTSGTTILSPSSASPSDTRARAQTAGV